MATGWSERLAALGRSYRAAEPSRHGGRVPVGGAAAPVPGRELHPDNGNEFVNDHQVRYWLDSVPGLRLSRSRPYQKHNSWFVEQKNASRIRTFFDAARFDTPAPCAALNALCDQLWVY